MRVLAISGSLRRDSQNTSLLRAAGELLSPLDTFELWDGLREVPPYDQDDDVEPAPPAVAAFRAAVASADAVLIATPEYNSSIPGALKNALDWASRPHATNPFQNKPVAVIGSSAGVFGGQSGPGRARKVLATAGRTFRRGRARRRARSREVRGRGLAPGRRGPPGARRGDRDAGRGDAPRARRRLERTWSVGDRLLARGLVLLQPPAHRRP